MHPSQFLALLLSLAVAISGNERSPSAVCDVIANAGPDTALCIPGGTIQLDGGFSGPGVAWWWTPVDGLSNPGILDPIANITGEITYELTVYGINPGAPNLVANGDFELGNGFFSSDYTFVMDDPLSQTEMWPEGTYSVVTNPNLVHSNFASCSDHGGGGEMLVLNGAPNFQDVWCQTITVLPDSYYNFEAWVASVISSSPAQLQFSINGTNIGDVFNATSSTCVWEQFNAIWFSGATTNAEICIVNLNTQPSGNDFALDDIAFYELCPSTDEVTITLIDEPAPVPDIIGPDAACIGEDFALSVTLPDSPIVQSINWYTTGNGTVDNNGFDAVTISWSSPGTVDVCIQIETRCSDSENCITITVDDIPEPPMISGPTEVCAGDYAVYTTLPDEFTENILWSVPPGATLLTDPTADQAEVIWNNTGLTDICVSFSNHCGSSQTCIPVDIFDNYNTVLDTSLCSGSTIVVNGTTYGDGNLGGIEAMISTMGCDSTVEVQVEIVDMLETMSSITLCGGDSVMLEGQYQTAGGTYMDTFMTAQGCDSIATTNLIIVQADTHYVNSTTCVASEAGMTTETFTGMSCDSVVITTVALALSDSISVNLTSCNPADTGTSIQMLTNAAGCDSIITTHIGFASADSTSFLVYSCDSADIGLVTDTYQNAFGCDSVVTTETRYGGSQPTLFQDSSCAPLDEGIDSIVLQNVYGCDSMIITETILLPSHIIIADAVTCDSSEVGSFTETFTNAFGCDSIVNTTVALLPADFCTLELETEIQSGCPGDPAFLVVSSPQGQVPVSVQLMNTTTGDYEYLTLDQLNMPDTIVLTTSGEYLLEAFSAEGVNYIDSFTINIPEPILLLVEADTTLTGYALDCHGESDASASAVISSGGTFPFEYQWTTGDTTAEVNNLGAGTYSITVTDAMGCSETSSIILNEPPILTTATTKSDISCFGDNNGTLSITSAGGVQPFSIYVNSNEVFENTLTDLSEGSYDIRIVDANGCAANDSVYISEPNPFTAEIGSDTIIGYVQSVTIDLTTSHDAQNVEWSPVNCNGCSFIEFIPEQSTVVQVTATDSNGCVATDQLNVFVEKLRGIYAPNVFSPNNDGINDFFFITSGDPSARIDHLEIFNRWGAKVFATTDVEPNVETAGWDGTYLGQDSPSAVYVFSAVVTYQDGFTEHIKGDITLIR